VSHTADADELLEVPGDELRAVVRDDPGPLAGKLLARPLEDRLHLGFGPGLADLPVDDEPAVAVEDAAQEGECPADINMRDSDRPVLMRPQRRLEALALLGGLPTSAREFAGRLEYAVDAGRAHGHDIGVAHHVRFIRILRARSGNQSMSHHPINSYRVSWIARIFSLKNSLSRNP
jgi:hypothetical protein